MLPLDQDLQTPKDNLENFANSRFLTELDGVYYMDPPPNAYKAAHKHNMYQFSRLLLEDIWKMLAT